MSADWIDLARTAHREFGTRVAAVENWSAPTPDSEWDVSDLVRHVVDEQVWIPPLLAGSTVSEAQSQLPELGDDLAAEWKRHSATALSAWASVDLDATVHLSYADVKVEHYLREQVSDVAIHAWDLAKATGADATLPDDLIAAVWEDIEAKQDMLAASGLFGAPIAIASGAPLQDRLLALTGRQPG